MSELPSTWATTTVGAVIELNPKTTDLDDSTLVGFVPMALLGKSSLDTFTFQSRPWAEVKRGYSHFCDGDVLLAKITPCFENGKAGLARGLPNRCGAGSTEYFVCRPRTGVIDARYLLAFLKTAEFVSEGATQMTGSVGHKRLPKEYLSERVLPLPPLREQTRIADQLDTLLARIQACNERLDAIPALLTRFRQLVLGAAVGGGLTAEWRKKVSAPAWRSTTFGQQTLSSYYGPRFGKDDYTRSTSGIPTVRTTDMDRAGRIRVTDDTPKVLVPSEKLEQFLAKPGDLLVTRTGSIGVMAVFEGDYQAIPSAYLIRFRFDAGLRPRYAYYRLASPRGQTELGLSSTAVAQPNVNAEAVKRIALELPSVEEQDEIILRVEALLRVAEQFEARLLAASTQAGRLAPLTLAKAFRGELVQQDPTDESASVVLQRLAKTPTAAVKAPSGRPRRQQANPVTPPPPVVHPDWAALPAGAWAASAQPDEHATAALLIAVLKAWGQPMPQEHARLAAVLCLQPRLFTAVLPATEAASWRRLVGAEAAPLPAAVTTLQPAVNTHWRRALAGLRARGDLVASGSGPQDAWALGPGAERVDTAGWPDGRAGWVVAYLRTHGVEAVLPSLSAAAVDFVHARAA